MISFCQGVLRKFFVVSAISAVSPFFQILDSAGVFPHAFPQLVENPPIIVERPAFFAAGASQSTEKVQYFQALCGKAC